MEEHSVVQQIETTGSESSSSCEVEEERKTKVREVLLEASESGDWQDAVEEWSFSSYQNSPGFCVCGQEVAHEYFIKNDENETVLCLGKDCLQSLEYPLLTEMAAIVRKEQASKNKRVCACCLKLRISKMSEPFRIKCSACYQNQEQVSQAYKNLFFGACKECGDKDIAPGSPEWKSTCGACYEAKKSACRECKQCGQKRISPKESEYTKICFPCKKEGGYKQCESCGEYNIFAAEKWKKTCVPCWRKNK